MSHDDFAQRGLYDGDDGNINLTPSITVVREPKPKYVLIMETTSSMDEYNQWKWINKAAQKLIRYDLPEDSNVAIVTFGNGTYLSMQAQKRLEEDSVNTRVIDLNWLSPLPEESLLAAAEGCKTVLIVDETRRTGGLAEALMALFTERSDVPHARLVAEDSFIPTGPAYAATMPSADGIIEAAHALVRGAK